MKVFRRIALAPVSLSLDLLLSGRMVVAVFAFVANWFGNLCPVVIQRQHRFRIQTVRARERAAA